MVNNAGKLENFRKLYGLDPETIHDLFVDLQSDNIMGDKKLIDVDIKSLFLTIYWLKSYDNEEGVIRVFEIRSRVTLRRHTRKCLDALQALCEAQVRILKANNIFDLLCFTHNIRTFKKISWPYTGEDLPIYHQLPFFLASVDGVHCSIEEPRKVPSKKWFSHKSNGPALTYQVVIALRENKVLFISGPYPAGQSDIIVFRKDDGIKHRIPPGKRIVADRGYNGEPEVLSVPSHLHDSLLANNFKRRARARQETFNARLKEFKVLDVPFRHLIKLPMEQQYSLVEHKRVFESISVMVQYDLKYRSLFDI
jgi:DDE superfamily endonuclease